jgi:hypothetical protein
MIPTFSTHNEAIEYTRAHPECIPELLMRYEDTKAWAKRELELGNIQKAIQLMSACDADRNGIMYAVDKHPGEKQ